MIPESKLCKMLDNRNNQYVFWPFQDNSQVLKVEYVDMESFYKLLETVFRVGIKDDTRKGADKNDCNSDNKKDFLHALLSAEYVLITIEEKIMNICREIIKACGIDDQKSRIYTENLLKDNRQNYLQNLVDYIKQKVDTKQLLTLHKLGLVDKKIYAKKRYVVRSIVLVTNLSVVMIRALMLVGIFVKCASTTLTAMSEFRAATVSL